MFSELCLEHPLQEFFVFYCSCTVPESSNGGTQLASRAKLIPRCASQSARIQQGMKWLWYVWELKCELTATTGSTAAGFFQRLYFLVEGNREHWAARDIPRLPPCCVIGHRSWSQGLLSCEFVYFSQKWQCLCILNASYFPSKPCKCYEPHLSTDY